MATDLGTVLTYNNAGAAAANGTALQNAIAAGGAWEITAGNTVYVNSPNLNGTGTLQGAGILDISGTLTLTRIGGASGITWRGATVAPTTGNLAGVIFRDMTFQKGVFRVEYGCATTGLTFRGNTFERVKGNTDGQGDAPHLELFGNNAIIEQNTVIPTSWDAVPIGPYQSRCFMLWGSGNIIRDNTINCLNDLFDYTTPGNYAIWIGSAIAFNCYWIPHGGSLGDGKKMACAQRNWVYRNTITNCREESSGPDLAYAVVKTGYVTSKSGNTITLSGGKGSITNVSTAIRPTTGAGFLVTIVKGTHAGKTYFTESIAANTTGQVTLTEAPDLITFGAGTSGDFVTVTAAFCNNRTFDNIIRQNTVPR